MGLGTAVREMWNECGRDSVADSAGERKTATTPLGMNSIFAPFRTTGCRTHSEADGGEPAEVCGDAGSARAINCIKTGSLVWIAD